MRSVYLPFKPIRLLLLLMLLLVGTLGVSYALFTGSTDIRSKLSMGALDVVFSDVYIVENSSSPYCPTEVGIASGGTSIEIQIADAYPGYCVCFDYEIRNDGTVPVVYRLDNSASVELLSVYAESDRLNAGETGRGQIYLSVGDEMEPGKSYSLSLVLNFQQVNVVGSSKYYYFKEEECNQ